MAGLLRPDEPFIAVHPQVVRALGITPATILAYIAFVEDEEGAELTTEQISQAAGVSVRTVKRATTRLREVGLLRAERLDVWRPTLTYRVDWLHPIITGQTVSATVALTRVPERPSRGCQVGTHLLSEPEEHQEPPAAVAADPTPPPAEEPPAMPVPASYQEPLIPSDSVEKCEAGPPKTAQTLVARWCDGYRASNGHDAPNPLLRRVAGHMKQLAKACGDSHPDWVAAYTAAYDAGRAGRWDPVGFMSRRQHPARTTNVFVDPSLGGPGGAAVTALAGMLAPQRPELGR